MTNDDFINLDFGDGEGKQPEPQDAAQAPQPKPEPAQAPKKDSPQQPAAQQQSATPQQQPQKQAAPPQTESQQNAAPKQAAPQPAKPGHKAAKIKASELAPDEQVITDTAQAEKLVEAYEKIVNEVGRFIVGQEEVIEQLMIAILARGHCLLEGVPGLAKTALVSCLSKVMQLSFRRIQFTPDLMPSDITGTDIIQEDQETGHRQLIFEKGPIFAQMVLADEINRTPPKTQAALLEAMQEHSVTIGGRTMALEEPFFVLATQNPIEQEGTYPLPEAQRDRFMFHVKVFYPEREEEREIVRRTTGGYKVDLRPVIAAKGVMWCQELARKVPVPDHVMDFVLDLVRFLRPNESEAPDFVRELVDWGAGPRACQMLVLGGKVRALLKGRVHVAIEDIEAVALPVLRHRIVPTFNAEAEGITVDEIIKRTLNEIPRREASGVL
jgi:MoxR-like ATPase